MTAKACARTSRLRTSAVRYRTLSQDDEFSRAISARRSASRSSAACIRKRCASQIWPAAADRPYHALRHHRLSDRLDHPGRALSRVPPPGTPLMLIRRVEGYGIDKSWLRLDNISPHLIRAAMAGEDARFCRHHGFDWGAIAIAWDYYQSGHGRLLGASTISMQTAKNVFLWPGRNWLRKGFEAWFTVLIELAWGKRRIMEIYLNIAG